jgi:hypothetical protein
MKTNQAPWFNFLSKGVRSDSTERFYDTAAFDWTAKVEREWQLIADELTRFLESNERELKSFYADQGKWKSFGLYAWGICLSEKRCRSFTETLRIIKQIPGVVTVMAGVMEPHSEIRGHYGDTDAIYRCHLPLIVPGTLPEIGFEVDNEKRAWEEGKLMIFNDAKYHRAWNDTSKRRVVLIMDVIKPEYMHQKTGICERVLTGLAFQKLSQKIGIPKRLLLPLLFLLNRPVKKLFEFRLSKESRRAGSLLNQQAI